MEKLNKDEKRISAILSMSLMFLPFIFIGLREWAILKNIFSRTLLEWISIIIATGVFFWIISGFISLSKIIQSNSDMTEEIYNLHKKHAQTIEFNKLKENPNFFKDEYVKYNGLIVHKADGDTYTHIWLDTADIFGYRSTNVILVELEGNTWFEIGNFVSIYGKVHGTVKYEKNTGGEISIPAILGYEIISHNKEDKQS